MRSAASDDSDTEAKPSLGSLLTYDQVLQWWEEEYIPPLLKKGRTRAQVDQGAKPRADGKIGSTRLTYSRPICDRNGVVLKTKEAWCGN